MNHCYPDSSKILSIDVGIKNLAFCLLVKKEEHYTIEKWDVINLAQQCEMKCKEIDKNNQVCDKPAKFTKNGKCYCLKHSKKQDYQIPNGELKTNLNKKKIQDLYDLAEKYKITYTTPIKKNELISLINDYIHNTCFEQVESSSASKIDLVTIGRNIQSKFDTILDEHLQSIDKVIIENQISPIANRMKTIQGMIAQYFIMKNNNISIEFVSSVNKLKDDKQSHLEKNDEKMKYSDRKKKGIQKCLEIITNTHYYQCWEEFFSKHTKKDDLADSFLQGLWYVKNKI
jgi:hypothetical protein